MEKKKCRKCGVEKPFSEFHKNKQIKNGLHPYCKMCRNEVKKGWNKINKEKIDAYNRERYRRLTIEAREKK